MKNLENLKESLIRQKDAILVDSKEQSIQHSCGVGAIGGDIAGLYTGCLPQDSDSFPYGDTKDLRRPNILTDSGN